jgi:hypothetical protein
MAGGGKGIVRSKSHGIAKDSHFRIATHLTNLTKVFWPEHGYTKRDLIDFYREIAPALDFCVECSANPGQAPAFLLNKRSYSCPTGNS